VPVDAGVAIADYKGLVAFVESEAGAAGAGYFAEVGRTFRTKSRGVPLDALNRRYEGTEVF
jgi:hypothetical protein